MSETAKTPNIYKAIAAIIAEDYAIGKEKKNLQQNYKFRGIDDVMNTFKPILAKHGVFVVPDVISREREDRETKNGTTLIYSILTMRYTFYAADGSSVSAVVVGEGMDSGDKASNKAMAVAMKYALFQVFCIPTEEMPDPDAETPEPSRKKGAKPAPAATPAPDQGEPSAEESAAIETAKTIIAGIHDAESANAAKKPFLAIKHAGDSQMKCGKMFNARMRELGLVYNAEARRYEAATPKEGGES